MLTIGISIARDLLFHLVAMDRFPLNIGKAGIPVYCW